MAHKRMNLKNPQRKKFFRRNRILTTKVDYAKYDILPPKTTNSIRTVDLPDNIITMLKDYKNEEKRYITLMIQCTFLVI